MAVGMGRERVVQLDGLRGMAILLVLQFHFWGLMFRLNAVPLDNRLDRAAHRVAEFGWSGVDLFFVLSGFLITGILLDARGSGGYLRSFFARRALRIVPAYYAFLAFLLFLAPLLPAIAQIADVDHFREIQFWYWAYLINVGSAFDTFDVSVPLVHAHLWSLAVEEQFYLVWPFVALLCSRRMLIVVCVAAIAGAFGLRYAIEHGAFASILQPSASGVLMPARMDTLALGGLIAVAARSGKGPELLRIAPYVLAGAAFVLGMLVVRNGNLSVLHSEVRIYGFSAFAFLYGALLVLLLFAGDGRLARAFSQPWLTAFGKYSYAMYIVHLLIAFYLVDVLAARGFDRIIAGSQIPANLLFSAIATATTFAIGWISWRVLEQPLLSLKSRFTFDQAPAEEREGRAAVTVQS